MLVIFDCDGVLVDSEHLAAQVFADQLMRVGIALTPAECESKFRGHTLDYCLDLVRDEYPGALPRDFLTDLTAATEEKFGRYLRATDGIEPVLQWLRCVGARFCVASNGSLRKTKHSLAVTGLSSYFGDYCFSAEQVARGKPAPDLFLAAADRMGCTPQNTLVVEDSVAGVTAALRAEMRVLRFGDSLLLEGQKIGSFSCMAELPKLLRHFIQPT